MILAAGLGTRLKPYTDLRTKAFLPMLGVPMAQFALDAANEAGMKKCVINIHHRAEETRECISHLDSGSVEIAMSDETPLLLGSGGGLAAGALHFERRPFLVLNADVLCDIDLAALERTHHRLRATHGSLITLALLSRPPQPYFQTGGTPQKYREVQFNPNSQLIEGLGEMATDRPFFVGAAIIEPEALAGIPPGTAADFVPSILMPAIRAGKATAHLASGLWFDIGSPQLWLEAHLCVIELLETGRGLPPRWRKRIESVSQRLTAKIWTESSRTSAAQSQVEWVGPAYWSSLGDSTAIAPQVLGPNAMVYGALASELSVSTSGLAYRGVWTEVVANSSKA